MIFLYIAAPFLCREQAREAKRFFQDAGFAVTSRWIDTHSTIEDIQNPENITFLQTRAVHDVQDVYQADILVLLNIQTSEGKAVETGLALAWQKPIIIVGQRSNIFHFLPIPIVSTLNAAVELIRQWEAEYLGSQNQTIIEGEVLEGGT